MAEGMTGYIVKPYSKAALLERVGHLLGIDLAGADAAPA